MPDKRLRRTLNDLRVYCSHKEGGCEWVGRLGSLTQHLNAEPQSGGDRLSGCQLTTVTCTHCDEDILRRDLSEHENDACPQRP